MTLLFVRESLQDEQFVCLIIGATCNLIGCLEERQIQEVSRYINELELLFQGYLLFSMFQHEAFL